MYHDSTQNGKAYVSFSSSNLVAETTTHLMAPKHKNPMRQSFFPIHLGQLPSGVWDKTRQSIQGEDKTISRKTRLNYYYVTAK